MPALDGLRAVAVLLVIGVHSIWIFPGLEPYLTGGFLGVDIFFVLSGFLIASILLNEFDETENISLRNFYARRFLRLMPAYWVHLFVLYAFGFLLFAKDDVDRLYANDNFIFALLYLTNWHAALNGGATTNLLGPTWTLAVEEQFYLLWPGILLLMLRRFSRKSIMIVTGSGIFLSAFFRAVRCEGPQSVDLLYYSFDSRADALLVGCLLGQIVCWGLVPRGWFRSQWTRLLLIISVGTIAIIPSFTYASNRTPFLYLGGFTIFAIAVAVLILWLATETETFPNRILSSKGMVWVGKISYPLYLWHLAAIGFVRPSDLSPLAKLAVAVALSFGLAAMSYYLVEKPFLKLKKRFSAGRSTGVDLQLHPSLPSG